MILVLGVDAATWTVIDPNIDELNTFKTLCQVGKAGTMVVKEKIVSPSIWCSMFSGKSLEEHGHDSYVVDGNIVSREDINVDFIWDILSREGKKVIALNVPFIVPPYSFAVSFKPVGFGLPTNEQEWQEELERITEKTKDLLKEKPDVLISVYTLLDRIQHFHWGEPTVLEWYKRVDDKLGEIIIQSGFIDDDNNKLIVVSDHGFCSFGEARIQTLPLKSEWGELKGDHHENAIIITKGMDNDIVNPQDVFFAIREVLE